MMNRNIVSMCLAMAMAFNGLAVGQTEEASEPEGLTAKHILLLMDANRDGSISLEESPQQLAESFAMVDADASGGIDETEADMIAMFINSEYAGQGVSAEQIMTNLILGAADTNGDGKLNRDEAVGELAEGFSTIDANHDGWIDAEEGLAVAKAMLEGEEEAPQEVTAAMIMANLDADSDGLISMEEAPEQLQQSFGMVDSNADGGIDVTEAEMIAAFMNN